MLNMKNTQHLDYLDALSTQELEALIQGDWQQEGTDNSETISRALAILEERGALPCNCVDVDAAWQEFQTHYNIPEGENASLYPSQLPADRAAAAKRRSRSIMKALSAAAAVFALVLFMAMPVFGEKSLIQHVGQWTKNVFTFSDGQYHSGYAEEENDDIIFKNTDLADVYKEVLLQGCNAKVVPTWIPDGFSLIELSTTETPRSIKVVASFSNNEKIIVLSYAIRTEMVNSPLYYEKSDDEVAIESIEGIDHYSFRNASQYVCCWVTDGVECSISGNIAQEELLKIVRSIYSEVEESEKNN